MENEHFSPLPHEESRSPHEDEFYSPWENKIDQLTESNIPEELKLEQIAHTFLDEATQLVPIELRDISDDIDYEIARVQAKLGDDPNDRIHVIEQRKKQLKANDTAWELTYGIQIGEVQALAGNEDIAQLSDTFLELEKSLDAYGYFLPGQHALPLMKAMIALGRFNPDFYDHARRLYTKQMDYFDHHKEALPAFLGDYYSDIAQIAFQLYGAEEAQSWLTQALKHGRFIFVEGRFPERRDLRDLEKSKMRVLEAQFILPENFCYGTDITKRVGMLSV